MAVTEVKPSSAGARGTASGEDPSKVVVSYSSTYRVTCSDPSDTAPVVLAYFSQNSQLPWMGRVLNFGNGFDASVQCKSVTADPIDKSGGLFLVSCEFKSLEGDTGGGQPATGTTIEKKNSDDPIAWHDEIDITYSNITEPVDRAIFRGFINGGGNPFMRAGVERAVTNSANVPYDPPLERENSIRVIRITRNSKESNYGTYAKYKNTVNSDAFSINKSAYGFRLELRPFFAKFTDFGQSFAIENKVRYWRETIEVQIHPRGWRRQIPDRGLMRRLTEGDKDDAGNTISAGDITDGWVHHTPIKDKDGLPITEPVLLDGNGKPIGPSRPTVWLIYSVEDEIPFAGIKW